MSPAPAASKPDPSTTAAREASGDVAATSDAPRRGRPRSIDVDQRLLDATLELASEVGINAMSMDDVAQRAGASKATIYRRWPSKEALVLDALRHSIQPFDDIDTGSLREDLDTYLRALASRMANGRSTDVVPHLIEVALRDESLRASLDEYVQHRRRPLVAIFTRGVERGELPAGTDITLLIDLAIGPFVYRRLLTHTPLDDAFVDGILEHILPTPPRKIARS